MYGFFWCSFLFRVMISEGHLNAAGHLAATSGNSTRLTGGDFQRRWCSRADPVWPQLSPHTPPVCLSVCLPDCLSAGSRSVKPAHRPLSPAMSTVSSWRPPFTSRAHLQPNLCDLSIQRRRRGGEEEEGGGDAEHCSRHAGPAPHHTDRWVFIFIYISHLFIYNTIQPRTQTAAVWFFCMNRTHFTTTRTFKMFLHLMNLLRLWTNITHEDQISVKSQKEVYSCSVHVLMFWFVWISGTWARFRINGPLRLK